MNKIIFHSNKHYNDVETAPCPTAKVIPKWWQDADIYIKDLMQIKTAERC